MSNKVYPPLEPSILLGVVAHPDDLEFGMAGAVATYVAAGAKAYYLILTNGNKGSSDRTATPEQVRDNRREEQRVAAKILGISDVFFCDYEDGELTVCPEVVCDVVRVIRRIKPDVVLTMDPTMVYSDTLGMINHPDHRAAGQATLDAVYPFARDHLAFPELCNDENLEPHITKTVLMVNFEKQNFYVDITEQMETKLEALQAHASQLSDPQAASEMVRNYDAGYGARVGSQYAEGYMRIDLTS